MQYTSKTVYEFISKQTNDPIVEWRVCRVSGQSFAIYQSDMEFYKKISPTFNSKKFDIPTPTLCPEERQRRRLAFRNERKLYRRKCDFSGKDIISIYSPDKPYKVYDQKIWWSDVWDPMDYGRDFDFSKTFTEKFKELLLEVPCFNLLNVDSYNSEYTNHTYKAKDCYLCFSSLEPDSCLYTRGSISSSFCNDCSFIETSEQCYDCVKCKNCYQLFYSIDCIGCVNSYYLQNCEGCECCFQCCNLHNKKYCINNKQYTKEEYNKLIDFVNYDDIFVNIRQSLKQINCEESFGNNLINCKKCVLVSDLSDCEGVKYTFDDGMQEFTYDCYGGSGCNYCMELMSCAHSFNTLFTCYGNENTDILYSNKCYNSKYLFGCIGLRNKSYCIFNKQYTKEEYENLVSKIITHMQETGERGEFFHPSLSPFGYNETVAMGYFPVGRDMLVTCPQEGSITNVSLQKWGYRRSDYSSDPKIPDNAQVIKPQEIDDEIWKRLRDDDTILKQVILCAELGRPFMIQKAELEFYRKHNLLLPKYHPDVRHEKCMKLRPGKILYLRNCDCCYKEMLSVYSHDHTGKIYCESCYTKEIYS